MFGILVNQAFVNILSTWLVWKNIPIVLYLDSEYDTEIATNSSDSSEPILFLVSSDVSVSVGVVSVASKLS